MFDIGVIIGEFFGLFGNCFSYFLVVVVDVYVIEFCKGVEYLFFVLVFDMVFMGGLDDVCGCFVLGMLG